MISVRSISRNLTAFAALAIVATMPLAAAEGALEQAVRLYDDARYAEALPLLEEIVAGGDSDGIQRYRLYFCRRATGAPAAQEALEQARELLEQQVKTANGFEAAFYLANAYTNLGRAGEVPRVAAETTARFEGGEIEAPTAAQEQFRLGKLYADQGRELDAQPWFEKAVEGFAAGGRASHVPYLDWAARWLGERAMKDERFEAAARQYAHVRAAGKASLADLDALAMASLMIGSYDQAGEAWRAAARMNPAEADRYRYGAGLSQVARDAGELPISPDGERSWEETSREELETILRDQSQKVRETRGAIAEAGEMTREQRAEFAAQLIAPRPLFAAAALEYLRRGLSLREAAFFGGYAPLVFKPREWEMAPAPRKLGTPAQAAEMRAKRLALQAEQAEQEATEDAGDKKKKKRKKKD